MVNLGEKAKAAKEIVDIFMDGVEDRVLESVKNCNSPERLIEVRAYYKACLALEAEINGMINKASMKENTLDDLKKRKGD